MNWKRILCFFGKHELADGWGMLVDQEYTFKYCLHCDFETKRIYTERVKKTKPNVVAHSHPKFPPKTAYEKRLWKN